MNQGYDERHGVDRSRQVHIEFEVRFGSCRSPVDGWTTEIQIRDRRTGEEVTFPGRERTGWAEWIVKQLGWPNPYYAQATGEKTMIDSVIEDQVIRRSSEQEKLVHLYRQDMSARRASATSGETLTPSEGLEMGVEAHMPVSNRAAPGGFRQIDEASYGKLGPPQEDNEYEVETAAVAGQAVAGRAGVEAMSEAMEEVDEAYVLDAWYAEYGAPGMTTLLRNPTVNKAVTEALELVMGDDDRVRITNGLTTEYPWRCICSLRMVAADGSPWIGSGWLVGPRTVITAGHCIYMHERGGWVRAVEVIPGRDANQRPFGSCIATDLRSVVGWTQHRARAHDYGAIILPADCALGETVGWFSYGHYEDGTLANSVVNLSGYPGDKQPLGSQWFHSRTVEQLTPTTIEYLIDTYRGQSGAPVWWRMSDGERIAVGIHTNGDATANSATRITEEVYNNIVAWKDVDG